MAHFAQLDENNTVIQVIVVANNEVLDENGVESEDKGIAFCQSLYPGTVWRQTSYNGNIRKNYAGIKYTYREDIDAFVAPQPYLSWSLNESSAQWEAPTPMPADGKYYTWNEQTTSWGVTDATFESIAR
jgi:hypothetical protein